MLPGIVLLNFGEPETPSVEDVVPFLEAIFATNMRLEHGDPEAGRQRARELAARRAPGLVAEYEAIGGSPLNARTRDQARALRAELESRGRDAVVTIGMQFTAPGISDAVAELRDAGVDRIIGLPLYPLCGPSTTVAALHGLRAAVDALDWAVPLAGLAGWHTAPGYTALRADGVRAFCDHRGIDLDDPATRLVFSAHGTPLSYLREGSRYDVYVEDHCRRLGRALGTAYVIGYQNHANRPGVAWTQPDVEAVLAGPGVERVVVVPVSFMQEQSETLNELDRELREAAEAMGLGFHRVPVPAEDPAFVRVLADAIAPVLVREGGGAGYRRCRCVDTDGVVCPNEALTRSG